jgi:hypothetical protein
MGQGGPQGVDKRKMFQFTEGFSYQPFGGIGDSNPSLYAFSQEKRGFFGATGSLFEIKEDRFNNPVITKRAGQFRQMQTNENDMFSRAAKRVAERQTSLRAIEQARESAAAEESSSIENQSLLNIIKRRFDVAE